MERRAFLFGVSVAALVATLPAFAGDEEDRVLLANYDRFRDRLISLYKKLTADGYVIVGWELGPLRDGCREARILFTTGTVLVWEQPWEGDSI
jgi:hypothetical protein